MKTPNLLGSIARKNANPQRIAERVIESPELIEDIVSGLGDKRPAVKYRCEKILRAIGEMQPDLLYPRFDFFASLLDSENNILKWGAIITLANLTKVDADYKFEQIFERYYAPIVGPRMITAANTIGSSARIALTKPHLANRISQEILKVENAKYQTPECRNVAIGHAIDAFDQFFEQLVGRAAVLRFIKRQLANPRVAVQKRAARFLKKHKIDL